MKLNKERTGRELSLRTMYSPKELKEKMNTVSEYLTGIFVPSDVNWEGVNYSFYISHRQSLREYIDENGFEKKDFFIFIRRIISLFDEAYNYGIDPHEFVFDYECVFVGDSVADAEFIYAPDIETYKDGKVTYNKCSDMISILSLHIEGETSTINKQEEDVSEILDLFYLWENKPLSEKFPFPKDELMSLIIKPNLVFNLGEYLKVKFREVREDFLKIISLRGDFNMKLNGELLLKGIKYTNDRETNQEVNIGRDREWADVPVSMMYVSRKHATIYKENGAWYIKDLHSKNGTFVNGTRIASDRPFSLNDGYEITLGLPESKLIFCLP